MKIIALYLPQYHAIKENDLWWGKGYTEWDSLKRGKSLITGQYQPRVPLNQNYYDLMDINVMRWQTKIAQEHGVYGFQVYHYWFNGKLLLERPMENYLKSNIQFPFYFCWANEKWTTIWEGSENPKVLVDHKYDEKDDWITHFNYCLPFFLDTRYIKENGKPVFTIYNPMIIKYKHLKGFIDTWNQLAVDAGFSGIEFLYQTGNSMCYMSQLKKKLFFAGIEYYPGLVDWRKTGKLMYYYGAIKRKRDKKRQENTRDCLTIQDYDYVWNKIISYNGNMRDKIPGAFVDWDNTPRRGYKGKVIIGASPDKFKKYLALQIENAKSKYHRNAIVVFAWNEWSEGGYIEPDEKFGYSYLEAIHSVLVQANELEENTHSQGIIFGRTDTITQ